MFSQTCNLFWDNRTVSAHMFRFEKFARQVKPYGKFHRTDARISKIKPTRYNTKC